MEAGRLALALALPYQYIYNTKGGRIMQLSVLDGIFNPHKCTHVTCACACDNRRAWWRGVQIAFRTGRAEVTLLRRDRLVMAA